MCGLSSFYGRFRYAIAAIAETKKTAAQMPDHVSFRSANAATVAINEPPRATSATPAGTFIGSRLSTEYPERVYVRFRRNWG